MRKRTEEDFNIAVPPLKPLDPNAIKALAILHEMRKPVPYMMAEEEYTHGQAPDVNEIFQANEFFFTHEELQLLGALVYALDSGTYPMTPKDRENLPGFVTQSAYRSAGVLTRLSKYLNQAYIKQQESKS